jgi:hypothetical protein
MRIVGHSIEAKTRGVAVCYKGINDFNAILLGKVLDVICNAACVPLWIFSSFIFQIVERDSTLVYPVPMDGYVLRL